LEPLKTLPTLLQKRLAEGAEQDPNQQEILLGNEVKAIQHVEWLSHVYFDHLQNQLNCLVQVKAGILEKRMQ
jgi:hypothetical protein